jgi:hypothetical protein
MSARSAATTRRELLSSAVMVAGAAMLPVAPVSARPRRASADHVILVDWDGFGSDLLDRVPMPNLRSLIARGSLSIADSTYNTYSNSARASMSTGAHPEVHGNAGYYLDRERDIVFSQNRELRAQTINQALAERGLTSASVGWYMVQDFAPPTAIRANSTCSRAWRRSTRAVRARASPPASTWRSTSSTAVPSTRPGRR